ncbi:MAG TPA: prepilin peptidase [Ilumatobacteraceae bacterium]|nr:prepilin peptidase [Ilumatobacteraceae bacterium]
MSVKAFVHQNSINAATALLVAVAVWRIGFSPELPAVVAFIFGGVLLAVIDWKVQRLPTQIVYVTLAGVAAGLLFASLVEWEWVHLATAAAGAVLFANAFFLIWLVGRNFAGVMLIGFGDVRLAALLGLLLGWYGLPYVLYGAIAGHLLALVVAVATCLRRRKLILRFSFGPTLIAGALAVVLFHA